ncbi:Arf guanine nucleotide exchange factor sbh1 [Coemansia aciculifera]|uniref:Arf guanine nucleotide exchange factor sbh1 n=1 Tax=Coemansia aciculifera TaxID=417176 RepID=A0ACC1M7Q2_9FUNG|nr:Arf guanine nucleotide exchange factor sbh1 [Coemansia aciculifera]
MAESSAVKKGPLPSGDGPRNLRRARRGGSSASGRGGGSGGQQQQVSRATGSSATMMRLYTDDAPGLKVDPVVVLVLSLVFIASVFLLHIYGKLTSTKG